MVTFETKTDLRTCRESFLSSAAVRVMPTSRMSPIVRKYGYVYAIFCAFGHNQNKNSGTGLHEFSIDRSDRLSMKFA